jgi:preprotein translocase subunit SecG
MTILLTIIHIVVCFFLIAVILLQAGKGQGLAGAAFGGGNVDSLLGTKGADFLTKVTTVAAIGFMVTCLGLSILETQKSRSLLKTGQNSAPIDIDQIKKALEKVKAEAESKGDTETVNKMNDLATKVEEKSIAIKESVEEKSEQVGADMKDQAEALVTKVETKAAEAQL